MPLSVFIPRILFVLLPIFLLPSAGFAQSAYDQLIAVSGQQPGKAPDPGPPLLQTPGDFMLAGALAKQQRDERAAVLEIEKINRELKRCETSIASSRAIIAKAQQSGKAKAEEVARQALANAEFAKKLNLKKLRLAELKLERAKKARRRLISAIDNGTGNQDIRGVVIRSNGEVTRHARLGGKVGPMPADGTGQLAPGDEIRTGNGSSAELQLLSGRGSVTMGENSRFKLEKETAHAEVVRTLSGTFHFAIEKAADFQEKLEQELMPLRERFERVADDPKKAYENFIMALRAKVQKKLEAKTRGGATASVRGTEFLVTENQDGSCRITVIEGSVAVTDHAGVKTILVETGQAIAISPEGTLSTSVPVNGAALPRWWEDKP